MSAVAEAFVTRGWTDKTSATPDPRPSAPCGYCWQQSWIVVHILGKGDGWLLCPTCQGAGRVVVERRRGPR